MFMALVRILIGMAVACLVAGGVQVLFALTPSELAVAGPDRWQLAGWWALQTAAAVALIGVPFVFLSGFFSEVLAIRSFAYHVMAGVLIALGGFAVLYTGQDPGEPTLANNYAIASFITTGFLAGIGYWLVAGRFAGGKRGRARREAQREARRQRRGARHQERQVRRVETTKTAQVTSASSVPMTKVTGSVPSTTPQQ